MLMLFNPTSLEINVCSTSTFAWENDLQFSLGYPEIFGGNVDVHLNISLLK